MRLARIASIAVAGLALGVAACNDDSITNQGDVSDLASAFATNLVGFENTPSSFDGTALAVSAWTPQSGGRGNGLAGPGSMGFHQGPMMGGMGIPFLGGGPFFGFGRGMWGDAGVSSSCTFNASTGRVDCPPVTRNGITTTRSVAYATATGAAQQKWDSVTTDKINTKVTVTGTTTRKFRGDSSTTTVNHAGDRTVTGLAKGSTKITVVGASAGRENSSGKDTVGAYTAVRVVGDTTKTVVIPVASGVLGSPSSGSVVRVMTVTVTRGSTATTSSRREVVTYNGTDTATVVITKDGTTTTCKLPLKGRKGPPTCK